ncbi:MAG: polyphosphate kinase 1 [Phototrophicaceae bacterium]|jgi:polyphosphate kinase
MTLLPLELNAETYVNRELAWIEFNRRVLAEAQDARLPVLERLKFLAIFSNNLDEFYMVRVASYHDKISNGNLRPRPDGYSPNEVIYTVRDLVTDLINQQRQTLRQVFAELAQNGIEILKVSQLPPTLREAARRYYQRDVYPVLTPLAVDYARPFPFISNMSLSLAVWLKRNDEVPPADEEAPPQFVRLKIPDDVLPRILSLASIVKRHGGSEHEINNANNKFIWLEDLIAQNLDLLFPGMTLLETVSFRVTRNADIDYEFEQEEGVSHAPNTAIVSNMSQFIETSLKDRRFGSVVRLTVPHDISEMTLSRLISELGVVPDRDVYYVDGMLGASSLFQLYGIVERPDLRDTPYIPRLPEPIQNKVNLFDAIRERDILMQHPYDTFAPVEDFFRSAARDPQVLAIKTTLYRVGKNSPVVKALLEARDNDKQVTVLVELKARFDEENNLEWARALEQKGVHVTYGVEELPLKTHAKVALVVRREEDGVRRYVHLGTGNYNASTAKLYTDFGMFTCNDEIAEDISRLFNRLTGYAPATQYNRLLVAPEHLQSGLLALLDNEIRAVQAGGSSHVILKMNQLEEDAMILKLYEASQAGVQIDLIIRGLCCLRPDVPGLSENIRVRSIVGRFLEHGRVFYFPNAPSDQRIYCGSADWMRRNLLNRVEVVFPVSDPGLQRRLLRALRTQLMDNVGAWEMLRDGTYRHLTPPDEDSAINSQRVFMQDSFGLRFDDL